MNDNPIDLLNIDKDALLQKWARELESVAPLNKWDLPEELAWWAEYATRCTRLIELGAYNGASTKIMRLANPDLRIHIIDLWEDPGTHETFLGALADDIRDGMVTFHRMDTHRGLRLLWEQDAEPFDGLMIDAGHTEDLVAGDITLSLPLVKPGTLVCGHDYHPSWPDNGVSIAVKKLLPNHSNPTGSIWAWTTPNAKDLA